MGVRAGMGGRKNAVVASSMWYRECRKSMSVLVRLTIDAVWS